MGRVHTLSFLFAIAATPAWAAGDGSCREDRGPLAGVFGAVSGARDWVEDRVDDARGAVDSARGAIDEARDFVEVQTPDDLFPWGGGPRDRRSPRAAAGASRLPPLASDPGRRADVAPCDGRPGGLRIMSYNIRSTRESSLNQIARDINGEAPDFVALQEVDVGAFRTGRRDQPRELAERTGLRHHAFGRSLDRGWWGGGYGNAILSKYPILEVRTWKLPSEQEQRTMMCATVAAPIGETTLCSTHLATNDADRRRQVRAVENIVAGLGTDRVVLLGDFNETADKRNLRFLRSHGWQDAWELSGEGGSGNTSNARNPTRRIDYILVRAGSGLSTGCTRVPAVTGSDHRPVVTTIR